MYWFRVSKICQSMGCIYTSHLYYKWSENSCKNTSTAKHNMALIHAKLCHSTENMSPRITIYTPKTIRVFDMSKSKGKCVAFSIGKASLINERFRKYFDKTYSSWSHVCNDQISLSGKEIHQYKQSYLIFLLNDTSHLAAESDISIWTFWLTRVRMIERDKSKIPLINHQ